MKKYFLYLVLLSFMVSSCSSEFDGISPQEYIKSKNLEATELSNGVYIVIHEPGNEVRANLEDYIEVDYVGRLAKNDLVFSSADDFRAIMGNLIAGWFIGLQEIGEGGSATLIIPPNVAYGDNTIGTIPGKSVLVFDIDLKNIFKESTVDEYIEKNSLTTTELENGVHIIIHEEGNETKPNAESIIKVNYEGKLTNEYVFDSGEEAEFTLSNLIEGWRIGLPEIGEGGSCTLIIPSDMAYGENGNSVIPPNSPLVFEVELLDVKLNAVDQYINENNLETTLLDEGVHIIIHETGNDTKPTLENTVVVDYEGKLTDGTTFDSNTDSSFELSKLIKGWQVGLQEIGIGGSCTLIIPPSAGYGANQVGDIPPNSVLIFETTLKDIQ